MFRGGSPRTGESLFVMGSFSEWESVKEKIRDRVDFVSLVEEYVTLEEKGSRYWGLCPFHSEDTPSFAVTPDMGIFKCFGCGQGGDLFEFFMEIESCDFPEAMERLGERCGIELPDGSHEEQEGEKSKRSRLLDINEYCKEKFASVFWDDVGSQARNYMLDRGFTEDVLKKFNIGYAPDGWDNMKRALKRDGYDLADAIEAGVLGKSDEGRVYDKFRDRIMFPIRNRGGRTVGFGGRVIEENEEEPKYLNSKDTPVFSKRTTLYGLRVARDHIRDAGYAMVMEGYTDVIRCHQEGFTSAVGALGTALTEQHARLLKRFTDEVVLVYDGDQAGQQAARRGGQEVVTNGMKASVVLLPDGLDPADVLSDEDRSFKKLLNDRTPYFEALYDWLTSEVSPDDADGKEKILKEMAPAVMGIESDIRRREKIDWLSGRLRLEADFVRDEILSSQSQSGPDKAGPSDITRKIKEQTGETIDEVFFRSLASNPGQFEEALEFLSVNSFQSERSRRLMKCLKEIQESDRSFTPRMLYDMAPDKDKGYLEQLFVSGDSSKFAEGTDPVNVAKKIQKLDSSRHERDELAREIMQHEKEGGSGTLDETKRELLRQIVKHKSNEETTIQTDNDE